MKRLLVTASVALAALLLPAAARAQTATNTLTVTANVLGYCTIDPATLAFGAYDPAATTELGGSAALTIRCTQGSDFWVEFGPAGARQMANLAGTGETLGYELYRDATCTTVWDDAAPATPTDTPEIGLFAYGATVYGCIPQAQIVSAGDYQDDVTMTVHF
jgi:spore coat protein U-like protein